MLDNLREYLAKKYLKEIYGINIDLIENIIYNEGKEKKLIVEIIVNKYGAVGLNIKKTLNLKSYEIIGLLEIAKSYVKQNEIKTLFVVNHGQKDNKEE